MSIVSGVGIRASLTIQSIVDLRNRLGDLERQLGTGKRSDTYAGLGLDRGLTVGLRTQAAAMTSYEHTIELVGVRLTLAQTALRQVDTLAREAKLTMMEAQFVLDGGTQTSGQKDAFQQLDHMLSLLNSKAADRSLFAGAAADQQAVDTVARILDGDGPRAGLKQIISERRQADVGSGLGRLVLTNPLPNQVQLAEEAPPTVFGLKLSSVTSTLSNTTVTGPVGVPPAITVDLAADPAPGETLEFIFTLPDGTTESVKLTATNSLTPGVDEFTLMGLPALTRPGLQAALNTAVTRLANTELTAASAVAAGRNFFDTSAANPPQRVAGPPFATATALTNGTPADTVNWYLGEAGSQPARSTATARVDESLTLSYGMRANEQAPRIAVQSIAVFAAMAFSDADPNASNRYDALKQRLITALDAPTGQQKITDIEAELAGVQTSMAAAKDRHTQSEVVLQNFLQQIEGVPQEEVATQILALQTSLQATMQTTALLLRTNLLEYI